jgi:hypothetical protein
VIYKKQWLAGYVKGVEDAQAVERARAAVPSALPSPPSEYGLAHVYARDVHSGSGNCVCGRHLGTKHVQAAPGVPIPDRLRP